jgi:hypothetical protein
LAQTRAAKRANLEWGSVATVLTAYNPEFSPQ